MEGELAKILFVSKDLGGSNVLLPLATESVNNGHDAVVIAEGLAASRFEKGGFGLHFKGTNNFLEEPFTLDAQAVLKSVEPEVVVVSLGFPVNLERLFAVAARDAGISLVAVEDYWGVSARLEAITPSCVFTLDEYGEYLSEQRFPGVHVSIVGNSGVRDIAPRREVGLFFDRLRGDYECVLAFIGGFDTARDVALLVESLKKTDTNWCLIPRLHPKCEKVEIAGAGETYGDLFRRMIAPFGDRVLFNTPDLRSEEVVVCADATLSSFSTMLVTAAYAGKSAVSLQTRDSMALLKTQTGLDEVPLVALSCAHKVDLPTNLSFIAFTPPAPLEMILIALRPYNAQLAYTALKRFLP